MNKFDEVWCLLFLYSSKMVDVELIYECYVWDWINWDVWLYEWFVKNDWSKMYMVFGIMRWNINLVFIEVFRKFSWFDFYFFIY